MAIRHSICRWCYPNTPLPELCAIAKSLNIESIELLEPDEVSIVKSFGLTCAIVSFPTAHTQDGTLVGTITHAFNNPNHHSTLIPLYQQRIIETAQAGSPLLICFSGNRNQISDADGLIHCANGLKPLLQTAQDHGVTLTMELLNSKIDHPDYMADHSSWGVELCKTLNHPNFKLLYDIYHMQIMEGNIIQTIRDHHPHFAHYHTAGVPGRRDLLPSQELNYPAILQTISETHYSGFIGHEFLPLSPDPSSSLAQSLAYASSPVLP